MEFVWVYWNKGARNDELRWSIRSVYSCFDGPVQITLVGDKPSWYRGKHIPVKRVGGPANYRAFRDSFNKLKTAVFSNDISADSICWMMDDVYLLHRCREADLRQPRNNGRICNKSVRRLRHNKWQRLKARTAKKIGLPNLDFATHLPHVIDRQKWIDMYKDPFWDFKNNLWLWENVYGNLYYENSQWYSPFFSRLQRRENYKNLKAIFEKSVCLNHIDPAFNEDMRAALFDRFPTPAPVEAEECPGLKSGFQRGTSKIQPQINHREPVRIIAVVPWRPKPDREPARRWVREYLENRSAKVIFADSVGEPFSRSEAINQAVEKAKPKPADVIAVCDADCFITSTRWFEGANAAAATGRLVIPHDSVCRMTPAQSQEVLKNYCPTKGPTGKWFRKNRSPECHSGITFLKAESFFRVNGYDANFRGWGGEDTAHRITCNQFLGATIRLDGPLFHFHHEREAAAINKTDPEYLKNKERWLRYRHAADFSIHELISQNGFKPGSPFGLSFQGCEFDD